MTKDSNDPEKREPVVSLSAFLFFGGALIWAANQNWVEMAQFFRMFTEGWRDFLRNMWTEAFAVLRLTLKLEPHQKDILSLGAILLGGAMYRVLFGKKPQTLFFPSAGHLIGKASQRFDKYGLKSIASFLLQLAFVVFAALLYVIVLWPFVDIRKFSHDIYFVFMAVFVGSSFYNLARSIARGSLSRRVAEYRKNWKAAVKRDLMIMGGLIAIIVVVGLLMIALSWVANVTGIATFFANLAAPVQSQIDPRPFVLADYLSGFFGEAGIDLVLILLSVLLLYITAGKSLKPLAQFVLVGVAIVLAGWASRIVIGN